MSFILLKFVEFSIEYTEQTFVEKFVAHVHYVQKLEEEFNVSATEYKHLQNVSHIAN